MTTELDRKGQMGGSHAIQAKVCLKGYMDTITLTTWKAPATPSTDAAGHVKREPITNIR